jgi:hypothetical protein
VTGRENWIFSPDLPKNNNVEVHSLFLPEVPGTPFIVMKSEQNLRIPSMLPGITI